MENLFKKEKKNSRKKIQKENKLKKKNFIKKNQEKNEEKNSIKKNIQEKKLKFNQNISTSIKLFPFIDSTTVRNFTVDFSAKKE